MGELTQWEGTAIYNQIKAMSKEEQQEAAAAIRDEVLWGEMHMRFFRNRDRLRNVVKNLRGENTNEQEI